MNPRKPYKIEFSESEVNAIGFHAGRYLVADLLWKHVFELDDHTPARHGAMELTEPEMWELAEAWHDEGPLACGSGAFNTKLQNFIQTCI